MAPPGGGRGIVAVLLPVLALAGLVVFFEHRRSERERERERVEAALEIGGLGAIVGAAPRDELALDRAIDARDPALFAPRLTTASCAEDTSAITQRAARLAMFRFVARSEGELASMMDPQLAFLRATVVSTAGGVLPPRIDGHRGGPEEPTHRLVLLVDALEDPTHAASGSLRGTLVLWQVASSRPVCAAPVDLAGAREEPPASAHAPTYARMRLVMRALTEPLDRLVAVAR